MCPNKIAIKQHHGQLLAISEYPRTVVKLSLFTVSLSPFLPSSLLPHLQQPFLFPSPFPAFRSPKNPAGGLEENLPRQTPVGAKIMASIAPQVFGCGAIAPGGVGGAYDGTMPLQGRVC